MQIPEGFTADQLVALAKKAKKQDSRLAINSAVVKVRDRLIEEYLQANDKSFTTFRREAEAIVEAKVDS